MPHVDWQTVATLICIVLAGHFIIRRLLLMTRGGESHRCGSCPSQQSTASKNVPLVPLDDVDQR